MRRSSPALLTSSQPSTSKLSTSLSTSGLLTLALCLLILSTSSFAEAPDRIGPIAPGQTVALVGSVPPKATPQYDKGPIDPQFTFGSVTLQTSPSASQEAELDQLMTEQQDPTSPHYHQWLTPAQYADRFGLSHNDIDKITTWLKAQGFTVTRVAGGRNSIVFSGTALQIENAFQTSIHNYNVEGAQHFANAAPLKIPAAWAGVVTGVRGLHSFRWKAMSRRRPPHKNYYDSTFDFDFLAPGDVATLYDINALYNLLPTSIDGTGQKLAIIGETDIYLPDINDFRTGFGLTPIPTSGANSCASNSTTGLLTSCSNATNLGYVLVGTDPGKTYPCGDLTEADTDIEWSGATARNAQIIYVNAPAIWVNPPTCTEISGGGVVDALSYAIAPSPGAPPVAPVISMSYGGCELESTPFLEAELKQAVTEGVTVVNSSGDTASAACDGFTNTLTNNLAIGGPAVNYPASSQYVTGVGGSAIPFIDLAPNPPGTDSGTYWGTPNPNPTDGASLLPGPPRIPEEAWNDPFETAAECVADPSTNFCTDNEFGSTTTALQVQESPNFGIGGGGGGASNCYTQNAGQCTGGFPQPSYQNFSPAITGAPAGVRYVPDVSLVGSANYPGYIFCTELTEWGLTGSGSTCAPGGAAGITNTLSHTIVIDGVEYYDPTIIGGTSVSTPIFAGMVVLLNQYLGNSAGMSNINPTLYSLAKAPSNDYFHQLKPGAGIDTGNNQVYCDSGQPSDQPAAYQCPTSPDGIGVIGFESSNADATTGYNLVTGLGSVDLYNLAVAWLASEPNFTLSDSPGSLTITTGGAVGTSTITVTSQNSFNSATTLSATGLPSGVTAAFSTNPVTPAANGSATSTLSLTASSGASAGTATVTVTGTSGSLTATTTIALTVSAAPNFTLSTSPSSLALTPGGASAVSTITVNDLNGFSGSVAFTGQSGLPSGVTAAYGTNPTATTSTFTLTAAASALPTATPATVTITGTSMAGRVELVQTTTIAVSVNQNITVSAPTATIPASVPAGESATSTFVVTALNGATFLNGLTFVPQGLPDKTVSCTFSSVAPGASSPQTVTVTLKTSGPNAISGNILRRRSDNRSPWLPLTVPLAGIVMVGFARRKMSKFALVACLCVSLLLLGLLVACGGSSAAPIVVDVTPDGATVFPSYANWPANTPQTTQFTASVPVTWAVTTANGGSISSSGLYTAPPIALGLPGSATIVATSQTSSTATGQATETITPTTVPTAVVGAPYAISVQVNDGATQVTTSPISLTVQ
jgi:hypothetical protein